jgi:hypothetical protein
MAIVFLVDDATGTPIKVGDTRTTFRGDKVTVTGWPSDGRNRVYCRDEKGRNVEWFPSVINARLA